MDILSNLTNLLGAAGQSGGAGFGGGMSAGSGGGMGGALGALAGMLGGGSGRSASAGGMGGGMGGALSGLAGLLGGGAGGGMGAMGASSGGDPLGGLGSLVGALLGGRGGLGGMTGGGAAGGMGGLGALGGLVGSLMSGQGGSLLGQLLGGGEAPPAPHAGAADAEQAQAVNMLRALVYAAKADGTFDEREKQSIAGQVQKLGLGAAGQQLISQLLSENVDPNQIARNITSPEEALQIYALSCAITRVDTPMERNYLDILSRSLGIPSATKTAIEQKITG